MLQEKLMQIAIARPQIGDEEKEAVVAVLSSGELVQGKKVAEFEALFAAYHGAKHAVAVNNGTTALMAAMMAHGIGRGDEVIIPAFSFFATASCIMSVGAYPVFADIDPETYNLSPESAESVITEKTKAIMPVHLYGYPADMPRFEALCQKYNLVLLEDAAQAHGASINDRCVGTWGTASFSFYPTKNMTTGEGGMVLTEDDEIARRLRMIRNQGMNTQYYHETLGYNFRMTNMSAAIGIPQLKHLPDWTRDRIANAEYLNSHLQGVITPVPKSGFRHVYHQYTVRVPEGISRDAVVKRLNERGIGVRVYYPLPIYKQPVLQQTGRYDRVMLPETDKATQEVFSLPVHPALTDEELAYIVDEVNKLC
jgi:dTDP-4-amino-4,6-dideoxygalactose transaminase